MEFDVEGWMDKGNIGPLAKCEHEELMKVARPVRSEYAKNALSNAQGCHVMFAP